MERRRKEIRGQREEEFEGSKGGKMKGGRIYSIKMIVTTTNTS